MPPSSPSRTRPAALVLALGVVACGSDDAPADASCPDAADPCECDATRPECSGSGASSSTSTIDSNGSSDGVTTVASEDDAASSGPGDDGAAFSLLPPFDVVGTEWVFENENLDVDAVSELVCRVEESFTWPDGQPGATRRCIIDGRFAAGDERYALYPDRIQRRENGTNTYDPPADFYRVPLQVGDAWEVSWSFPVTGAVTESWTVLAEERVELAFGSFDAAKLELRVTTPAGERVSMTWWVDGIGVVRSESENVRGELLAFTQP
jgi:hypothetical protein